MTEHTTRQPYPLIKRSLKRGVLREEAREFIANLVNLCSSPTWSELYAGVLEPLCGLTKGALAGELQVTYATLRGWKSGRIPQEGRFEGYTNVLSALTDIEERIMHESRSRSIAAREGGLVVRPGWCMAYDAAGVLLYHYLRRLRDEAGLTATEAADLVGVSEDDWVAFECGKRTPRNWQLPRIWRRLGRPQGVLLCEMAAARDRGAAAAYNERRRKARVVLDNREALVAIEYGWSLSDAADEIRELDENNDDHRWDYDCRCFEPWWLRKMLRDLREGRLDPQPITDITTLRRFLDGQLRRPGQAIPLGGPRPGADAEPDPELTAEDILQADRLREVWLDSQRRQYELGREEEEEAF